MPRGPDYRPVVKNGSSTSKNPPKYLFFSTISEIDWAGTSLPLRALYLASGSSPGRRSRCVFEPAERALEVRSFP